MAKVSPARPPCKTFHPLFLAHLLAIIVFITPCRETSMHVTLPFPTTSHHPSPSAEMQTVVVSSILTSEDCASLWNPQQPPRPHAKLKGPDRAIRASRHLEVQGYYLAGQVDPTCSCRHHSLRCYTTKRLACLAAHPGGPKGHGRVYCFELYFIQHQEFSCMTTLRHFSPGNVSISFGLSKQNS